MYGINQQFRYDTKAVSLNLTNPPLVIDFLVSPRQVTDQKWFVSRNSSHEEITESITGPSPNAWFTVTVSDKNSGELILQDGYGRQFGIDTAREIKVLKPGLFRVEFTGNDVTVQINMSVKEEGNLVPFS